MTAYITHNKFEKDHSSSLIKMIVVIKILHASKFLPNVNLSICFWQRPEKIRYALISIRSHDYDKALKLCKNYQTKQMPSHLNNNRLVLDEKIQLFG